MVDGGRADRVWTLAAAALSTVVVLAACTPRRTAAPAAPASETAAPAAPAAPAAAPKQAARPTPPRPARSSGLIENYHGPLEVAAGQSIMLRLRAPAERVAIADPEVAEVVLINPREVVINGKGKKVSRTASNLFTGQTSTEDVVNEAQTSIIVWDREGRSDHRSLYVNRARAEQVMLEVTVADVNRTAVEAYGFDFQVFQGKVLVSGTPSKIFGFNQVNPILGAGATSVAEELNVLPDRLTYMVQDLNNDFLAFIELLQRESLAKILARPVILARSGEEAHFRVGGESPIPLATQNIVQVTFKEFGVLLHVTPTLTDDGMIDLRVGTEVSEPDFSRAILVGGFQVPNFVSRRAETRVRLREAEHLLIGGLYREDVTETEDKVPYFGDIPYLGVFFRRTRFDKNRNELMILVKPSIARSTDQLIPAALPTDRGPLTRGEVRTQQNPYGVTRPRLVQPPSEDAPGRESIDKYFDPNTPEPAKPLFD
jgi:pilus assembly protein CpaC